MRQYFKVGADSDGIRIAEREGDRRPAYADLRRADLPDAGDVDADLRDAEIRQEVVEIDTESEIQRIVQADVVEFDGLGRDQDDCAAAERDAHAVGREKRSNVAGAALAFRAEQRLRVMQEPRYGGLIGGQYDVGHCLFLS